MTISRASKPIKRDRQRITRTACEPCREKRAKCDGEKPCGRCQTRKLECHFTQRTWASKQSLQDEAASLREQVHRRERVLDAICASDANGDEVLRMLREGGLSYDEAYEKVRVSEASKMNIDTGTRQGGRHNSTGSCDCDTCWSPSTIHSNMLSSASGQSLYSFMEHGFMEDTISQPSTVSEQLPHQPNSLQQQMDPMQSIPWATSAPDAPSFGAMLDGTTMAPPVSTSIAGDCPSIFDPMLWPPLTASDPLGQPMLNSWTGLMGDPTDASKAKKTFACIS